MKWVWIILGTAVAVGAFILNSPTGAASRVTAEEVFVAQRLAAEVPLPVLASLAQGHEDPCVWRPAVLALASLDTPESHRFLARLPGRKAAYAAAVRP